MSAPESERRLGEVFDEVADAYDEVRPGYPEAIVDEAIVRGALSPGARVLEVGCGTGKLTELLVARGLHVDAVDPGPRMIDNARKRVGLTDDVVFHVGRFEEVALPQAVFDGLFSATAFHWLDPRVSWGKAASHLKPGGLLALLTHSAVHDERSAEADRRFLDVLRRYAPTVAAGLKPPRDLDTILAGAQERSGNASEVWDWIMGGGRHHLGNADAASHFEATEVTADLSFIELTADDLLSHFRTTSLYFQIEPAKRSAFEEDDRLLVESLGGTVPIRTATFLMTAQRGPALAAGTGANTSQAGRQSDVIR